MTSESLNLNSLVSSLPSHSLNANSEKQLLDNFKAAALSITTLYRSSRHASKRAYSAGYAAACRDLMEMLQLGVSDSHALGGTHPEESVMTIGRVMDWVEARLEAVKAREEEEDEEDERERGTTQSAPNAQVLASGHHAPAPRKASSPSPPPACGAPSSSSSSSSRSTNPMKSIRTPPQVKPNPSAFQFTIPPPDATIPISFNSSFAENLPLPVTGSKRRHAVMMMPAPASSVQSTPSSSSSPLVQPAHRRRTRSTRAHPSHHTVSADTMMDVEDDGRERKRVARR